MRFPERSSEQGQLLIETIVAVTIFLVVAVSSVAMLTGGAVSHTLARQRTLAEQLGVQEMEKVRQLPYGSVGLTTGGDPKGTVVPTTALSTTGLTGQIIRKITWVNDPAAGTPYVTKADYKLVTITIKRSDGKVLTTQSSYVSPYDDSDYGGPNVGTLSATVVDMATNSVVPNATVTLSGGPSAGGTETTDATGTATFPSLVQNPTSGSTRCYEVTVTPPIGYSVFSSDKPNSCSGTAGDVVVTAGQTAATTVRVYEPAALTINVTRWKAPFTSATSVTLSGTVAGSSTSAGPYTVTGGSLAVPANTTTGSLAPSSAWTASATSGSGASQITAVPQTLPIPDLSQYPGLSTGTINLAFPDTTVKVYKRSAGRNPTCTLQSNQTVTVTGGPDALTSASPGAVQTTNSSGVASFDLRPGIGYSVASSGSAGSATLTTQTVSASPTVTAWNVTVLASGATGTCP